MNCLKPEEFIDLLEEGISDDIQEHIDECSECRKIYNEIKDMSLAVSELKIDEKADFNSFLEKIPLSPEDEPIEVLISMINKLSSQVSAAKEVLDENDVKILLQLDEDEFESISNDIPAISICGKKRYLKSSVMQWLSDLENEQNVSRDPSNILPFERLLRESY